MIDYVEHLENRGFDCRPSGEHNVFISCPFHEEGAGSCSVNIKTGGFHCFGCDESGSFAKLIAEIEGIDIGIARLLLNDEVDIEGIVAGINNDLFEDESKSKRRYISEKSFHFKFPALTGDFLDYIKNRGISDKVCDMFDLRCGVSGKWSGRVVMPLKNIDGRIIGFTGRAIYRNPHLKARTHIAYPKAICDMLFGLYECKDLIKKTRSLILVEGPVDSVYLITHNLPAVARLGKNLLSAEQVKLLLEHVDRVVLAYDGDKNGLIALEAEYERLSTVIPVIPVRLPKSKDPNDLTSREIRNLFYRYF